MNLRLPTVLAAYALAPFSLATCALSAQLPAASAQAPATAPAFYAASSAPASFSSSIVPDALASTASATQSSVAATPSNGSSLPFSGVAVAVNLGLGGIGFDVATPLIPQRLNLRGGASFLSYSPSTINADNLNINGTIKFQNASTMVDWFPFHGRFRLSGGATLYNNTGLTATLSVPTGQSFSVGGIDYYSEPYNSTTNPAGPIQGTGVFTFGGNKIAPRATIGFGNMLPKKGRFTFQTEIGFQYFSAPTVQYTFSGTGCTTYIAPSTYLNCGPIPQANVISEQNKLQNDIYDLRFFPILSFGLSYKIH